MQSQRVRTDNSGNLWYRYKARAHEGMFLGLHCWMQGGSNRKIQQKDPTSVLIYGYMKITMRQVVPNWSSNNRYFVSRVVAQEAKGPLGRMSVLGEFMHQHQGRPVADFKPTQSC